MPSVDDEKHVIGHVFRPDVAMDVSNVLHGSAHGVEKRRAAGNLIVLSGKRGDLENVHPVMKDDALLIEKNGGKKNRSPGLLLLFQHGVESADGVGLQPEHGAAAVENEDKFGHAVHSTSSRRLIV